MKNPVQIRTLFYVNSVLSLCRFTNYNRFIRKNVTDMSMTLGICCDKTEEV